jgi:hypothetical protein
MEYNMWKLVRGAPCEEGPGERAEAQDRGRRGNGGGAGRRRLRVPRAPRAEGGPLREQAAGAQGAARARARARLLLLLRLKRLIIPSIEMHAGLDIYTAPSAVHVRACK